MLQLVHVFFVCSSDIGADFLYFIFQWQQLRVVVPSLPIIFNRNSINRGSDAHGLTVFASSCCRRPPNFKVISQFLLRPSLPPWAKRGLCTHFNTRTQTLTLTQTRTFPHKHTLLDTHTHICFLTHTLCLSHTHTRTISLSLSHKHAHMHQPARARTHAHGLSAETRCAWEAWGPHRCCRTITSDYFSPTTKSTFNPSISIAVQFHKTFRAPIYSCKHRRWKNLTQTAKVAFHLLLYDFIY